LPVNSQVIIDAKDTVYVDYDVLELIRDFVHIGSKDKNINIELQNFKEVYNMEDINYIS
jgi:hypothetical protein